ncbi:cysteine hydrolase [Rhodococcus sp. T2V]|uniref:cysteine hydrolase family protein n=1 Tax=Rhodococcus sp. T2V TaxID=3034164 RepID=UPI0023E0B99F|nr:isochorismatase family cysteine hydrolase [Rhodococcus sp. T2V]MDF3309610.1 cysteine hydrolase [Rhodococcus sp. T2V]
MAGPKTAPLALDPARTVVLAIDIQNSFTHPDGLVARTGGDREAMISTIPHIRNLVEAGRERGMQDIWTQHVHYPDDAKWTRHQVVPHSYRWDHGPSALKGTWEADFADEVKDLTDTSTEIIEKHRFSAFFDTRLDTLLRMLDARTVIITGLVTTHCVEGTARDAYQKDYDVIVPAESVAAFNTPSHEASLSLIDNTFGKVLPVESVQRLIAGDTVEIDYRSPFTV